MSQSDRLKWDARWLDGPQLTEPSAFVAEALARLPRSGRALDVAAGTGRHAIAFALHGLDTTAVDVSPIGLAHARCQAHEKGVTLVTRQLDLELVDAGRAPFPPGPWDVILGFHYLWRDLPRLAASELRPGGLLLYSQPTLRNLERHPKPSERFLLREGELAELVAAVPELEVVLLKEGWLEDRHEARVIARRATPA